MTPDLAAPPIGPIDWEARLGRRVILVEDRLWYGARAKARAAFDVGDTQALSVAPFGPAHKPPRGLLLR